MDQTAKPLIDQPKQAKPKGPEAKIFTMPAKYRGTAKSADVPAMAVPKPEKVVPKRKPVPPPVPAKPKTPPPPPPKPKAKPPAQPGKKKKGGFPVKLAVIGLIIIALFAAVAIVVWFNLNQDEPDPEITRPIIPPVVEEEEEEPPVVEEEEEPPVEEEEPGDPFEQDLVGGVDSDSDGLTDVEEALYGTSPQLPDSDEDGFLDGNEVFHRYNPNGTAPGSLFESGLVKLFDNPSYSFSIFYPSVWTIRALPVTSEPVVFTATTGEVVQVMQYEKDPTLSIIDWFLSQDGGATTAEDLLEFTTKEGYSGVMNPDRLTAYIDAEGLVYVVSYNVGTKTTINYLQTFQMMLNSLVLR